MMRDELRCTYNRETGELKAEARAGGMSGVSSASVLPQTLEAFARELDAFPIREDAPPTFRGGGWAIPDIDVGPVYVEIGVHPADKLGALFVRVVLAAEFWEGRRPEMQPRVQLLIHAEYASVQRFARDLLRLVSGDADEAVLEGAV